MSDVIFKIHVVVVLMFCLFTAESAAQNALEAHRHAHELACALDYQSLCAFAGDNHE